MKTLGLKVELWKNLVFTLKLFAQSRLTKLMICCFCKILIHPSPSSRPQSEVMRPIVQSSWSLSLSLFFYYVLNKRVWLDHTLPALTTYDSFVPPPRRPARHVRETISRWPSTAITRSRTRRDIRRERDPRHNEVVTLDALNRWRGSFRFAALFSILNFKRRKVRGRGPPRRKIQRSTRFHADESGTTQ